MPTIHELAQEAYASFERAERADGTLYTRTRGDAPDWVSDLVREAHVGMLPDDWRYETIREACGAIEDADEDAELDDLPHEFANGMDVYTHDLVAWLGSHGGRPGYCDEATEEFGSPVPDTIDRRIMLGQYAERLELFGLVLEFLRERAKANA